MLSEWERQTYLFAWGWPRWWWSSRRRHSKCGSSSSQRTASALQARRSLQNQRDSWGSTAKTITRTYKKELTVRTEQLQNISIQCFVHIHEWAMENKFKFAIQMKCRFKFSEAKQGSITGRTKSEQQKHRCSILGSLANGKKRGPLPRPSSKRLGSSPLCVLDYISPLRAVRSSNTLMQIKHTHAGRSMCPTPAEKTTQKSARWPSRVFAQARKTERQTHRRTLAMVVALVRSFWLSGSAMFYFSPLTTWEDCLTPCAIAGRFLWTAATYWTQRNTDFWRKISERHWAAFKHCMASVRDSRQSNIRMWSTPTPAADPISGHIIYRALVEMKRQQLIDALQKKIDWRKYLAHRQMLPR